MPSSPRLLARLSLVHLALPVAVTLACTASAPETPPSAEVEADPAASEAARNGLAALMGKPPPAEWKFDFKDPGPGPRAPSTAAFGATVGTSMFADVEAHVHKLGLTCGDTSIRALMDRKRVAEKQKIADARARGEDAVTAASWVDKRSKREANPQLRFSCPKVTSDQITDRPRQPASGRLLYVFDDAAYPLRHASYQRTHKDHAAGLADFQDSFAALTKIYGPPTKPPRDGLPTPGADGKVELPSTVNFEAAWEYADLIVRVNVLRYGELVTVGERVEVPHGLRPDAPRFAAGAAAPAPAPAAPDQPGRAAAADPGKPT